MKAKRMEKSLSWSKSATMEHGMYYTCQFMKIDIYYWLSHPLFLEFSFRTVNDPTLSLGTVPDFP